jgi:hypothetical protein
MSAGRIGMTAFAAALFVCAGSFSEGAGDGLDEFLCSAEDPVDGWTRAYSYYQGVQEAYLWHAKDSLDGAMPGKIKIGVSFLDGEASKQQKVREYANYWVNMSEIPIEWDFDDKTRRHVRITFKGMDNWSLYGRQMLLDPDYINNPTKATMHLGVYNENSVTEARIRQIILHEFGHVLGLMHEHLNPKAGYHFNLKKIIADLKDDEWCKTKEIGDTDCSKKIIRNITGPQLSNGEWPDGGHPCVGAEGYDRRSIMMYTLGEGWTDKNQNYPIYAANQLSFNDLACVRNLYFMKTAAPDKTTPDKTKTDKTTPDKTKTDKTTPDKTKTGKTNHHPLPKIVYCCCCCYWQRPYFAYWEEW